jgi:O-antigen ligase
MDAPNCFGILTAMFFGLIFASAWRYRYKVLMLVLLSIALLLTLSYTAWAAIAVACSGYALANLYRVTYRAVLMGLLGVVVLLGSVGFVWNSEALDLVDACQEVIEAKSESADIHAQSLDTLRRYFSVASVVGLEPSYEGISAESQYVEIALIEGALYLLLFVLVMAAGLYQCVCVFRKEETRPEVRTVASATFCLLLAIATAGIGLPVMLMFPLNLLTALMLGVCSSGILKQAAFHAPGFRPRSI